MNHSTHSSALIAWMANRQSGSYRELRERIDWVLFRSANASISSWEVVHAYKELGVIGPSKNMSSWQALRKRVDILPGTEGISVLSGCYLQETIEDELLEHDIVATSVAASQDPSFASFLPKTVYLEASDSSCWRGFSESTDCLLVNLESSFADLVESFVGRAPELTAGPVDNGSIEIYDFDRYRFKPFRNRLLVSGIFRQRVSGRLRYWYRHGESWYLTSRGECVWAFLAHSKADVLPSGAIRYSADEASLYIHKMIAIPDSLVTLLVRCTGLLPNVGSTTKRFDNITPQIANSVQTILGINL